MWQPGTEGLRDGGSTGWWRQQHVVEVADPSGQQQAGPCVRTRLGGASSPSSRWASSLRRARTCRCRYLRCGATETAPGSLAPHLLSLSLTQPDPRARQARYRVLFNTLLAGAEDVDEGLVDEESPFKGTRLFGMSFAPGNGIAVTGTALHIVEHSTMKDGRLLVGSKGALLSRSRLLTAAV